MARPTPRKMIKHTIGFVGAGQMATALAKGMVHAGLVGADQLRASDASSEALARFEAAVPGAVTTSVNSEVATEVDVLVLAVKPQFMDDVLAEVGGDVRPATLIVSVAAGVTLGRLAHGFKRGARLVRVMPNTPCLIGKGAIGYCAGANATPEDAELVGKLLAAVGEAYEVTEPQLDAVTGLSGSGPAFVYTAIEALSDAGVRAGLPRHVALQLAARVMIGAGEMVLSSGEHPAALRDAVTSPGGTTAAGLAALERNAFRWALGEAVDAATARSRELGEGAD